MAKTRTRTGALLVAVMMTLTAAVAAAKKNDVKDRINHATDDALKAAKATKQQKQQVKLAMQEVVTASVESVGPKTGTLPETEPVLRLLAAPRLDTAALDRIRAERDAKDGKLAAALVHAFDAVHAALDHTARERLMAYETKRSRGKAITGFKKTILVGVANAYIDDVLESIGCSDEEKAAARVVRDHLFDAAFEAYGDPDSQYATIGSIFVPDELDQAALERFRDEREGKVKALTQAVEQAVVDLHAALTPEHRAHLAQIIRERTTEHAGKQQLGADAFQ